MQEKIPVSLYIHLPWCIQKCPYCDFNSHALKQDLPEELYTQALLDDWRQHQVWLQGRQLESIFFGGGTPSLFSAEAIEKILMAIAKQVSLPAEITLEANPGTIDQKHFNGYRAAGITRLSIGVQSLQEDKLKMLGRVHDAQQSLRAIHAAQDAGFDNINVDLMFGLPQQTFDEALLDIEKAIALQPTHISWYQLTLEPNTFFYKNPPTLPADEIIWEMQIAGNSQLHHAGYQQYEVSAFAQANRKCVHNLNYWEFGDYLGIGAGAHSKITDLSSSHIFRYAQVKHPKDYLDSKQRRAVNFKTIAAKDVAFEFMLNALRLTNGFSANLFSQRTGMSLHAIAAEILEAKQKGLLLQDGDHLRASPRGSQFLNDLIQIFLP